MLAGITLVLITRPWIEVTGSALSLSPLDLAEWLTLVPDVRFGADAMQTPLALRLIFALLVFALTLVSEHRFSVLWIAMGILACAGILLLMPPVEYFMDVSQRSDTNYTQLFHVGLFALFLVGLGLSGLIERFRKIALSLTVSAMIILTLLAVPAAEQYVWSYGLQSTTHIALWIATLILWIVMALLTDTDTKKGA